MKYVKPSDDKEAIARQIVVEQKISSGPVCVIKSVSHAGATIATAAARRRS